MTAVIAALFIALLALPQTAQAQSKEAYVVEDGSTLTFYYDANKATRTGTVYGINQKRADDTMSPAWAGTDDDPNERITKVVFDSSFKDYKPATTNRWFYFCKKLTAIEGMSNLITDQLTDMSYMFCWCSSLTSLDVSNFNTANVTDMSYMFGVCLALTSLDVSKFNTANVTDMSYMFGGCIALTSLDVSKFNTEKVVSMYYMFSGCSALTSLDVSNFNTGKVTDMYGMFYGCEALTSLDLSNFNTANVTTMSKMFSGCSSLTSLDVSNFNTANVTDMSWMFYRCKVQTSLDVSKFNTAKVTDMKGMFSDCSALTSLDVSKFNTANVTYMSNMFSDCSALTTIFCNDDWKSDVVQNSTDMFRGCSKLKGAVAYNQTKKDVSMANPTTGYFTKKSATGITHPTAAEPLKRQDIYNLQGVKMQGSLDLLPAGVYIVDGKKIVKK